MDDLLIKTKATTGVGQRKPGKHQAGAGGGPSPGLSGEKKENAKSSDEEWGQTKGQDAMTRTQKDSSNPYV
jgi:hypothetical protein